MSEINDRESSNPDLKPNEPINIQTSQEISENSETQEENKSNLNNQATSYQQSHDQLHTNEGSYSHTGHNVVNRYSLDRWDYLYQSDIVAKQRREEEFKQQQEELKKEQMKECSFRPKLYKNKKYNKFLKKDYNGDVYKRTTKWQKNIDKKIDHLQKESSLKTVADCTFAPDVSPERKDYLKGYSKLEKDINKRAIDKYLERMIISRLRQEEKQRQQQNKCGSGNVWTGDKTIPKAPKLAQSVSHKQLKSTNMPVSPKPSHYDTKSRRNECCPQSEVMDKMITFTPSADHLKKYHNTEDEYIKFNPSMTYSQAVEMIHSTILSLGS